MNLYKSVERDYSNIISPGSAFCKNLSRCEKEAYFLFVLSVSPSTVNCTVPTDLGHCHFTDKASRFVESLFVAKE